MSQKLTINLSKEEVTKLIKDNLVQEKNTDTPIQYDVKYDVKGRVYSDTAYVVTITVVENITIGEFPGKINEEIDRNTIERMLKNSLEIGEYKITKWSFNINGKEMSFDGIQISMVPSNELTTFIRELVK